MKACFVKGHNCWWISSISPHVSHLPIVLNISFLAFLRREDISILSNMHFALSAYFVCNDPAQTQSAKFQELLDKPKAISQYYQARAKRGGPKGPRASR